MPLTKDLRPIYTAADEAAAAAALDDFAAAQGDRYPAQTVGRSRVAATILTIGGTAGIGLSDCS